MVPRRPGAYDLGGTMLRRLRIENLVLIQEAELTFAPGLNAITARPGRARRFSPRRSDCSSAPRGMPATSGRMGPRPTSRPSSTSPQDCSKRTSFPRSPSSVPKTRKGSESRVAWRELTAARRRNEELQQGAAAADARLAELRALVEDTAGLEPDAEESLRGDRERLRHVNELADGAAGAAEALAPDEGEGAAGLVGSAERTLAPLEQLAPELARAGDELRDVELRLRETASELRGFLTTLEAEPGRLEQLEAGLDRIADVKRRFRVQSYDELLARAAEARAELEAIADGLDPGAATAEALAVAEKNVRRIAEELRAARREASPRFEKDVAQELVGVGLGEGEFIAELRERDPGQTGIDEVAFLVRPNAGLPLAPVAETASGGELSRIALAIAAVAGGETMVFDEIDAGIGGGTAHAVADTLRRLAERAQVVTITHLPQIASVADRHFRVEKVAGDPTHTRIEALDADDRRDELERMLGGADFLAVLADRGT